MTISNEPSLVARLSIIIIERHASSCTWLRLLCLSSLIELLSRPLETSMGLQVFTALVANPRVNGLKTLDSILEVLVLVQVLFRHVQNQANVIHLLVLLFPLVDLLNFVRVRTIADLILSLLNLVGQIGQAFAQL